ncbi:hypothetical protein J0S82_015329, partial [Galemys pyrenaicus]
RRALNRGPLLVCWPRIVGWSSRASPPPLEVLSCSSWTCPPPALLQHLPAASWSSATSRAAIVLSRLCTRLHQTILLTNTNCSSRMEVALEQGSGWFWADGGGQVHCRQGAGGLGGLPASQTPSTPHPLGCFFSLCCCSFVLSVLSVGRPRSSSVLMTPPIYARVQHRCAHLRMPTLECSQHHRCPSSVVGGWKYLINLYPTEGRRRKFRQTDLKIESENGASQQEVKSRPSQYLISNPGISGIQQGPSSMMLRRRRSVSLSITILNMVVRGGHAQVGTPELDTGINGWSHENCEDRPTDRQNRENRQDEGAAAAAEREEAAKRTNRTDSTDQCEQQQYTSTAVRAAGEQKSSTPAERYSCRKGKPVVKSRAACSFPKKQFWSNLINSQSQTEVLRGRSSKDLCHVSQLSFHNSSVVSDPLCSPTESDVLVSVLSWAKSCLCLGHTQSSRISKPRVQGQCCPIVWTYTSNTCGPTRMPDGGHVKQGVGMRRLVSASVSGQVELLGHGGPDSRREPSGSGLNNPVSSYCERLDVTDSVRKTLVKVAALSRSNDHYGPAEAVFQWPPNVTALIPFPLGKDKKKRLFKLREKLYKGSEIMPAEWKVKIKETKLKKTLNNDNSKEGKEEQEEQNKGG